MLRALPMQNAYISIATVRKLKGDDECAGIWIWCFFSFNGII